MVPTSTLNVSEESPLPVSPANSSVPVNNNWMDMDENMVTKMNDELDILNAST